MISSQVKVGRAYRIGSGALGKAIVKTAPAKENTWDHYLSVEVEHPDAPFNTPERRKKYVVEIRSISAEWTERDQEKFEKIQRQIENKRGWTEELSLAGYEGEVGVDNDGVVNHLEFSGAMAEKALLLLTDHKMLKEDDGE